MQQTEKYKLNLIESSDPFLPEGLNQNTRKMEDAMAAHEAAVKAKTDAMAAALGTGGHNCRIAWGTYPGHAYTQYNHPTTTLTFDFYPFFIVIGTPGSLYSQSTIYLFRGSEIGRCDVGALYLTWTDNSVSFQDHTTSDTNATHYYFAIGVDFDEVNG